MGCRKKQRRRTCTPGRCHRQDKDRFPVHCRHMVSQARCRRKGICSLRVCRTKHERQDRYQRMLNRHKASCLNRGKDHRKDW